MLQFWVIVIILKEQLVKVTDAKALPSASPVCNALLCPDIPPVPQDNDDIVGRLSPPEKGLPHDDVDGGWCAEIRRGTGGKFWYICAAECHEWWNHQNYG